MKSPNSLDERNKENKARKNADAEETGRYAMGSIKAGPSSDPEVAKKHLQVGRKIAKRNYDTISTRSPGMTPHRLTTNEAYTLEEWLGMMEEAGYKLNELSPETLASYRAKAVAQKSNIKDKYHGTTSPTTGQKYSRDMHGLPPEATAAGDQRKFQKRTAGIAQANKNLGQQAVKAAASGDNSVYSKLDYRDDDLRPGAAQWKIDRARQSALRQPTGQPKMAAEGTLKELSPELKARYMDKAKSQVSQNLDKVQYNKQRVGGSGFDQAQRAAKDAKRIKGMTTALGSMDKQLQQRYNNPQGNTDAEKAAHQKSTVDTFDRAADNLNTAKSISKMAAESINENTVARLQSLAGIKPVE